MEELISNASSKDHHFTLRLIEQLNSKDFGRKKAFIKYIDIIYVTNLRGFVPPISVRSRNVLYLFQYQCVM